MSTDPTPTPAPQPTVPPPVSIKPMPMPDVQVQPTHDQRSADPIPGGDFIQRITEHK